MRQGPKPPVYAPPRPNRGPEPWPSRDSGSRGGMFVVMITAALGGVAALGLIAWLTARGLQRRRSRQRETAILNALEPGFPRWTYEARRLLVEALGESWRTKTAEDIADAESGELAEILGAELARETVRFFRESDQARFGDRSCLASSEFSMIKDWSNWLARIHQRVETHRKAAVSTSNVNRSK